MLLMPSPLTSTATPFLTHVHADFYDRARAWVERGGFLYASVAADAAIPDMDALFGARLADTDTRPRLRVRIVRPFGGLEVGTTFELAPPAANARAWGQLLDVSRAEVIAEDEAHRPVLVAHRLGKGRAVLAAFPIESWLAVTPSAFDRPSDAERFATLLYRALEVESGVVPPVRTGDAAIEATLLRRDRGGYAVVVNHGPTRKTVSLATAGAGAARRLLPSGPEPVPLEAGRAVFDLDGFDGTIVELR